MTQKALTKYQGFMPIMANLTPAGSIESYIHFANNVPMLTQAEEKLFATKLRQNNDLQAAQRLIMPHLRFVIKIARGFSGYGLQLADLIQEGNIGLMKAVKRFNPEVGVRLVSFAVHWIKAEMHEFIIKNWRIVKIATTKAQRKLFFNLRNSKKRLGWFSKEEIHSVADALNVKPSEVLEMEQRLNAYDEAFDAPEACDEQDHIFSPSQYLTSSDDSPEETVATNQSDHNQLSGLQTALEQLDARSKDIVNSRWLADKKATLHELAAKHGVSAERVRQIEAQAMASLKAHLAAA
mgnify:CR=1 FL=1